MLMIQSQGKWSPKHPLWPLPGLDLLKPILPSGAMARLPMAKMHILSLPPLDSRLAGLRFLLSIPVILPIMVRISLRQMLMVSKLGVLGACGLSNLCHRLTMIQSEAAVAAVSKQHQCYDLVDLLVVTPGSCTQHHENLVNLYGLKMGVQEQRTMGRYDGGS